MAVATAPPRAPGTYMVKVADVVVGPRHRVASDVTDLRESVRLVGQLEPIVLRTDMRLVAGAHRLEACRQLGNEWILASVAEFDDLTAELAEIDENLTQHTLTVLERGEHASRRNQILRELGLRAQPGSNQHSNGNGGGATETPPQTPLTTAGMAQRAGIAERTLQRDLQITGALPEDVRDAVRDLAIADSTTELLALSRLPHDQMRTVVSALREGTARTVRQALSPATPGDPDDAGWDDADTRERLYPVHWEVYLPLQVPSAQTRMRGDAVKLRESETTETRVTGQSDVAVRERGLDGLKEVCNSIAYAVYNDEQTRADWERLP